MSMSISVPTDTPVVRLGRLFKPPAIFSGTHHAFTKGKLWRYNALSYLANSPINWHLQGGEVALGQVFGFSGLDSAPTSVRLSNAPEKFESLGTYDAIHYGNRYSRGWNTFAAVLSGGQLKTPSTAGENAVRHRQYVGSLIPTVTEPDWINVDVSPLGPTHTVKYLQEPNYARLRIDSLDPLSFAPIPIANLTIIDFDSLIASWIYEGVVSYPMTGVFGWESVRHAISDVVYVRDYQGNVRLSYHQLTTVENFPPGWTMEWDCSLELDHQAVPSVDPVVGVVYDAFRPTSMVTHIDNWTETYRGVTTYSDRMTDSVTVQYRDLPVTSIASGPYEVGRIALDNALARYDYAKALSSFAFNTGLDWAHIIPASAFSALDAFSQAVGSLETNDLETLVELPGVFGLIPDFVGAFKIIEKLYFGNISLATVGEVMDFLTALDLQYNFAQRPLIESVKQNLPVIAKAMTKLGENHKLTVGYGKFSTDLPAGALGREQVSLTVRTKIVMDVTLSGLLSSVYALDGVGLLPTPSRVMNLVSMSFLLDWATGLSGLLRRLERSCTIWSIPSIYIHTYTLESPYSEDELAQMQMTNSEASRAGLRLHYRDVSLYSPYPRWSKFNFDGPKEFSNWRILGSLFYQLLKR